MPLPIHAHHPLARLRTLLPQGRLLPEDVWQRRHLRIVALLWAHVPGLAAFGLLAGRGPADVAGDIAVLAALALAAQFAPLSRSWRAGLASLGLVTASAILVHFADGQIEAHFHFFVVVGILALYQDWRPFLLAVAAIVLHHGVVGALRPEAVYAHDGGVEAPWLWALVHGGFVLCASVASVITWRANEELLHDPLTGLASRRLFTGRLEATLETRARCAVILLDLDRFKVINDSRGHATGDELLIAVGARLRSVVGARGLVGRLGGDEFGVLLPHATADDAMRLAAEIRAAIAVPLTLDWGEAYTTASAGIALTDADVSEPAELLARADAAMYRAKTLGGDGCAVFDALTRRRLQERVALETDLHRALERGQLELVFQPELAARSRRIVSAEALLRWHHPERGVLAPAAFVPCAEETGLIVPIGAWVLEQACIQGRCWQREFPETAGDLVVRVNVSPRQLVDGQLVDAVRWALDRSGLAPGSLALDLTETALLEDQETAASVLGAVRRMGVRVALDDFGTGYSSLSRLDRLPIDAIRLDGSFVAGLGTSLGAHAIVRSVVDIGHALGLRVIAEGVERDAQAAALTALGYDGLQGYLLGRPCPAVEWEALLGESQRLPVAG